MLSAIGVNDDCEKWRYNGDDAPEFSSLGSKFWRCVTQPSAEVYSCDHIVCLEWRTAGLMTAESSTGCRWLAALSSSIYRAGFANWPLRGRPAVVLSLKYLDRCLYACRSDEDLLSSDLRARRPVIVQGNLGTSSQPGYKFPSIAASIRLPQQSPANDRSDDITCN